MAEEDDTKCMVCGLNTDEEYLVLCDGCDDAYHTYCSNGCSCCGQKAKNFGKKPEVPEGDWFCKKCAGHPPSTGRASSYKHHVYAWGDNESGQLGLGDDNAFFSSPQLVKDLENIPIAYASGGEDFSCVITSDGTMYSVGDGSDGKLGHSDIVHESLKKFRKVNNRLTKYIENMESKRTKSEGIFVEVHCGKNFSLAKTSAGHLFSWGSSSFGQLGHMDNSNKKIPKKNSALRQQEVSVDLVACGEEFVLMTSGEVQKKNDQFNVQEEGVFMTMGNNQSGQLATGTAKNQWVPQFLNPKGTPYTIRPEPLTSSPDRFILGRDIACIAAGCAHSIAVTTGGDMYSWGSGHFGQLGHPRPEINTRLPKYMSQQFRVPFPRFITAFQDIKISKVACGRNHTLAQSSDGVLYGFGSNEFGQIGLGEDDSSEERELMISLPVKIPKVINCKMLACGGDHSIVITETNKVMTWGINKQGQLGRNTSSDFSSTPELVEGLSNIHFIASGSNHSFAIERPAAFEMEDSVGKKKKADSEALKNKNKKKSKKV